MGLYSGNAATETGGGKRITAGAYKFRIEEAKHYANNQSIGFRMKIWGEDKEPLTEKMWAFFKIDPSAHEAVKAETDRKLTTILGKPSIESEKDLVGKTGWVVLREGARGAEPMPFGGFYTADKKSATGQDTILERISEAVEYDWRQDKYAVEQDRRRREQENGTPSKSAASSSDDSSDLPF